MVEELLVKGDGMVVDGVVDDVGDNGLIAALV